MKLYHGTSRKLLDSILKFGVETSDHEEWGMTVCAMDSLRKAKGIAADFGRDGMVLELDIPKQWVKYHPDYGHGIEFDTIHIMRNVDPSRIIGVIHAPSNLKKKRPIGMPLRQWKSQSQSESFTAPQQTLLKEGEFDTHKIIEYKIHKAIEHAKELEGWDMFSTPREQNIKLEKGDLRTVTSRFWSKDTAEDWVTKADGDKATIKKWNDERFRMPCFLAIITYYSPEYEELKEE